jgi:hypothetical protein
METNSNSDSTKTVLEKHFIEEAIDLFASFDMKRLTAILDDASYYVILSNDSDQKGIAKLIADFIELIKFYNGAYSSYRDLVSIENQLETNQS